MKATLSTSCSVPARSSLTRIRSRFEARPMIVPPFDNLAEHDFNAGPLRPFDYHSPTRVVFGAGTLSRLGELARELGESRVLLVTDPGLEEAGHPQRATQSLRE